MLTPTPQPYQLYIQDYPVPDSPVIYTNHKIRYTITADPNGNLTIECNKPIVIRLLSDRAVTLDHEL